MKKYNRRIINITAGIFAFLFISTTFAGIVFSDGSASKTFPTVTLKKKTLKFFRKRYERTWTMDTYARLTESAIGTKVDGRTEVKSTFHLIGFTGGVFVDVKDSNGNLIYRMSGKTGYEASGYENGHDVGWGVNPRRSRVKSWEVLIPPEICMVGKTVEIYQTRTKKKVDWNKVKAKINEITKNLGQAIKNFFDNHGDDGIILAIKYGPKINEMNKVAKAGTLQLIDVCNVMRDILADAKAYGIVQSSKAENLINIIGAVQEIVLNGKSGWLPENQEMIVALIQDIVVAVNKKNIDDATLYRILNNFEAFLNDKSGLVGANLQPIEVIFVNISELFKEKLDTHQIELFDTVIGFVSNINDFGQDPLIHQEKLDCVFAAARAIIDIRSKAIAGNLTEDYIYEKMIVFLDVNFAVLGLSEVENESIQNIIDSAINIINNSGEGFLPENQQELVTLIISIERIAATSPLNYNLINILINDLEKLLGDKGGFAPSSLLNIEVILTNAHVLIVPKLNDCSKVAELFTAAITIVSTINNLGEVPVADNLGVIFKGLKLAVNLLEQAKNKTITPQCAETQFNNWFVELEPDIKEAYPEKIDQIDAIKSILNNTFAIINNGEGGWDFDHWNAIKDIVKAGLEVVLNKNQLENMSNHFELKVDFQILLENQSGFVADNGEYLECIIEELNILCANNEDIHNALSELIKYLEGYNSWN